MIDRFKGKRNTNGFDKHPENINRKGQPKKGINLVNEELKKAGYAPATKQDIEVNYMSIIQLEQDKLVELRNDKSKPMLVRILAKNMLGGKGFEIIEKMLDRGIGKAVRRNEARLVDKDGNDILNVTIL